MNQEPAFSSGGQALCVIIRVQNIGLLGGGGVVAEFAGMQDAESWMHLLELVEEHFPGLDTEEYQSGLEVKILQKEALVVKKGGIVVGALAFSRNEKELLFLAVHPNYRKMGIAQRLIEKVLSLFEAGTQVSVITYREGDPLGRAARKLYFGLGFVEGELLTVFDYPCQKLIYTVK